MIKPMSLFYNYNSEWVNVGASERTNEYASEWASKQSNERPVQRTNEKYEIQTPPLSHSIKLAI